MNLENIKKRIKKIKNIQDDDEVAHRMEDDLYTNFIKYVSKRRDKIGIMAKEILKTKRIDFARWTG